MTDDSDDDDDARDFDDDPIRMAHDSLVKRSFGVVENARGELEAVLPAALVREIDWSTLEIVAQPSVSTKLRSREIDLLYRVKIREHPALLYTVFEAQRSIDKSMPLRMLIYMARIWEDWLRKRDSDWPPPPIVPMVLHHGDGRWTRSTQFADLFDLEPKIQDAVAPFTPHFRFLLDDLALVPDRELLNRRLSALASLVLGALKHGSKPDFQQLFLTTWEEPLDWLLAQEQGSDELETIMCYLFQVNPTLDREELGAFMQEKFGPEAAKTLKTAGQRLMHAGRQEGLKQGLEQGLEQGQAELLLQQLQFRFGDLSAETVNRVRAAEPQSIAVWAKRIFDAKSLGQVFEN